MQRYNIFFLLFSIFIYLIFFIILFVDIQSEVISFSSYLLNDLELFTSYLFKTHQHYMFISIFLLLLALVLSVFLSTKYISNNNLQLLNYK